MKKTFLFLLSLGLIMGMALGDAHAQKKKKKKGKKSKGKTEKAEGGKKEEKAWKKKKDSMDPMKFKEMVEGYGLMKREQGSLQRQSEVLKKQAAEQIDIYKSKEQELAEAEQKLESIQKAKPRKREKEVGAHPKEDYQSGVVFKVQMGAYQKLDMDMSEFNDKGAFFVTQSDAGYTKYTIGQFRDYIEAHRFRIYITEMGVKGAFVVAYKDNVRVEDIKTVVDVPYEERMEEILNGGGGDK